MQSAMAAGRSTDPGLANVLALVGQVVPGLNGALGGTAPESALVPGPRGRTAIQALHGQWLQAYPEAGPHYLALRCWGLAIWQPVYLCVIAAHLGDCVPRLEALAQPLAGAYPRGYWLPAHMPHAGGSLEDRMQLAAEEMRSFCDGMRDTLQPFVALHPLAAGRLQAECVLGALLQVDRFRPLGIDKAQSLGRGWLALLGLEGGCGFLAYRARDGTFALALDRKVCCHHFRRRDGDYCETCPKQSLDARIASLRAGSA